VNSFLTTGDTVWAASSGGLVIHDLRTGNNQLLSNSKIFPDPYLTAICRDANGNLWIGSQKGYLYKRTPKGQFSVYSNYKHADWSVLCLYTYKELIIVGSNKGVSLFDPQNGVALRNATAIGSFSNPKVNSITTFKDTLFLGCDEGVAYLDSLNFVPLNQRNFYYSGIWKTFPQSRPVISFVNVDDYAIFLPTPSAMFRGHVFTADSAGWILNNGERWSHVATSGKIVTMYNENDRRLWIGTDERHYFSYDGNSPPLQHKIDGLALRRGTRVFANSNGDVWVLPMLDYRTTSWHHAIYRYDGQSWLHYNQYTHGDRFGYLGDGNAYGIAAGSGGTVWVGTWGGNVKHINPAANSVAQLVIGDRGFLDIGYYTGGVANNNWGKVDALAVDSSGYLWASAYDHYSGSLICYNPRTRPNSSELDPVKAGYRWFFNEHPYRTENITELSVDIDNRIFVFDPSQNRLTVFSHDGEPLRNGIRIDTSYAQFGAVSTIRSASDGTTYIVVAGAVLKIERGSLKVETVASDIPGLSSLAVQEGVLWLGSVTNGVMRYNLDNGETKWIGEAQGLPSNEVISLAVDSRNGCLWIVTDVSVSRLDIGRQAAVRKKEDMRVFPNVFSISRRDQGASAVTFARLEPNSVVSVFSVNGALIAKVNAESFSANEWRAAWTPGRNLVPGAYIAVAKPSGKKAKILLKP
jgi:ligand-binding sensor domain-containing protein